MSIIFCQSHSEWSIFCAPCALPQNVLSTRFEHIHPDMKQNHSKAEGSPFKFFGTFRRFLRLCEIFFRKFLNVSKGSLHYSKYFATEWMLKNPKGWVFRFTFFDTMGLFNRLFRLLLGFLNRYPSIIFLETIRTFDVVSEVMRFI